MLCGIGGCTKPSRHTGLCSVIQKSTRLRSKMPVLPYVNLKPGTIINVWWDNYERYFTGRVMTNNLNKRNTKIKYVDGDVKWHNMEFMSYIVLLIPEDEPVLSHDNVVSTVKEMVTCSICYEHFSKPMTTQCMHTFCYDCLSRALVSRKCCPICNISVKSMRDAVPDARFTNLLTVLQCGVDTSTDHAEDTTEASYSLLCLAETPRIISVPRQSIATHSTATPFEPVCDAPHVPAPTMYKCHSCGGMKKAKAHICGKTCDK